MDDDASPAQTMNYMMWRPADAPPRPDIFALLPAPRFGVPVLNGLHRLLPERVFRWVIRRAAQFDVLSFPGGRTWPIDIAVQNTYFQHGSVAEVDRFLTGVGWSW